MSLDIRIRHSTNQDLQDMVILMDQLGYPTTYAEMQERYKHIEADANYTTLVAEIRGRVVGLIGMQTSYLYEKNGRHCRIMVLVIHEHYRGRGIGRQLLQAAEHWAAEHQVDSISLNSSNSAAREAAHAFYKEMGYTAGSTGFSKLSQQLQHI
ncbi:GNAT family N-acetyltransferase [Paenibacillus silvae]|uniref:GNAT family N-acetyltransferase n=1 Tax=Paenibacillus silvae TaxID=1325358 RepID=UPI0011A3B098|nr:MULTISPECIES: GNAT family N-acetyltransferase [Paenibacillus]MCK6078821.1 GNAT family N-acetyltransferase [Paenibacillus silvae]MCK6153140.1 GNAT family N-acetyltransferase [Paenibacillus silvae]MCK6271651.1 GNAT family N-acetyltransferase [Paenibacillus silvae]